MYGCYVYVCMIGSYDICQCDDVRVYAMVWSGVNDRLIRLTTTYERDDVNA